MLKVMCIHIEDVCKTTKCIRNVFTLPIKCSYLLDCLISHKDVPRMYSTRESTFRFLSLVTTENNNLPKSLKTKRAKPYNEEDVVKIPAKRIYY